MATKKRKIYFFDGAYFTHEQFISFLKKLFWTRTIKYYF